MIIIGYRFDWTGFNGNNKSGKTLWDWLQLLVIPVVIAVGGYVINLTISRSEQVATKQRAQSEREVAEKHAETEREIALDNQRETSLQEYIDKMSELFLHEDLLGSDPKKEVQEIARIRTLTVLNRLDGKRKGSVLQFLKNSELINQDTTIINLSGANLSGAYLSEAFLNGISLYHVDLSGANLRQAHLGFIRPNEQDYQEYIEGADLSRANLSEANLSKANLERADLKYANLTEADLRDAKLLEADLRDANLTGADLTNTQLSIYTDWGENAFWANLSNANLKDVSGISIEELEKRAGSLKGATMPDGSIHP